MPQPLAPRRLPDRVSPAGLLSVVAHGVLVGVIVWSALRRPATSVADEPDIGAKVELVLGNGGQQTGGPPPAAAVPPTPRPTPPTPPAPAVTPTPPQPKPEADAPPPPAQPAPPPDPEGPPAPQSTPQDVKQPADTLKPPPPPPPPAPVPPPPTPAPAVPPAPPPSRAAPPVIRLGDGIAAPPAEISGPLDDVAAGPDVTNVAPEYPLDAARRHEQGAVVVALHVDATGAVVQADIVQSSGSPRLDAAAKARLLTWHFHPAVKNGEAVPSIVRQMIDFTF